VDMASRIQSDVRVFSLDTGRLHPETYRFLDRVRERYAIRFEPCTRTPWPSSAWSARRAWSASTDGHQECCAIRKVGPLPHRLQSLDAWVTGQRRIKASRRAPPSRWSSAMRCSRRPSMPWSSSPARELDRRRCLGLHPHERRTLQRVARARLREHRLRAMHARRPAVSAGARRPVVAGRRRRQGVRAPQGERGRRPAERLRIRLFAARCLSAKGRVDRVRNQRRCGLSPGRWLGNLLDLRI
jgi:hypothetical protein